MAKTGDAMDVDSFAKGSPKGASKGSGKGKNSEACCIVGRIDIERPNASRDRKGAGKGKSKGKQGDRKGAGKSKKGFEGKCFKCGKSEHMSKDCRFKETNVLEMNKEEPLSEDVCFDRVECAGDWISTCAGRISQSSYWNRLVCSSDSVSAPETPTEESEESLSGVKYFGAGAGMVRHSSIKALAKVGGVKRVLKARVVLVRKPLLAGLRRALHGGKQLG